MTGPTPKIARILSSSELILNKGKEDGVKVGQIYGILDNRTSNIKDPETGKELGDFPRFIASVRVRTVRDHMSYAVYYSKSAVSQSFVEMVGGTRPNRTSDPAWPEAIVVGDELQLISES